MSRFIPIQRPHSLLPYRSHARRLANWKVRLPAIDTPQVVIFILDVQECQEICRQEYPLPMDAGPRRGCHL